MVTVFGLGFVGLTTALGFASMGYTVFGVEPDEARRELLSSGKIPFLEPHMQQVLSETLGKTFFLATDIGEAVCRSSHCFYCVGTPYGQDGQADLTQLFTALDETLRNVKEAENSGFKVLVIKCTVPPSTAEEKILPYIEKNGIGVGKEIGLVSNPEFLREGHCWEDFIHADRIVIGCSDEKSKEMMEQLYEPIAAPIIAVSYNTAEFIKYLSNALLATMISYSNEMALLAEHLGNIDVKSAFHALHMDRRWGDCGMKNYVYPGCGYGGYCLPKDTNALYAQAKVKGFDTRLLQQVIQVNESMPQKVADKIARLVSQEQWIGILGLAFKPCSNDVRDSSAGKIIRCLLDMGYEHILAHDPVAVEEFRSHYSFPIEYSRHLQTLQEKADVCVILTAWPEFQCVSGWAGMKIVDGRYIL